MSNELTSDSISQEPINILFSPASVAKKDIWEIDLIQILNLLTQILEKADKKDLKVAGMAAYSSSLIYKIKVESIFTLHKAAMERKPMRQRTDVDIDLIDIPYRHESTYPVSLDDLLGLLQNLIGTIANPKSRRNKPLEGPAEPPDFEKYFVSVEKIIEEYENLIIKKISAAGFGILQDIIKDLGPVDSIRCFLAALFLARDQKVGLEQVEDSIKITIVKEADKLRSQENFGKS